MEEPIKTLMLAATIAFITGCITDTLVPTNSEWVLSTGAVGFIGTLIVRMFFLARGQ